MFGEYESESPRVPSPWDSLISSPRSLSPSKLGSQLNGDLSTDSISLSISPQPLSPSPSLLPRLVPENDSGNVEYKLQLLNPSPARFARLVTQLKWRLLEGGGQAYYELGVADSGDLVGLGREELESSLDTLEMMAGEIGASVIVVKEIGVPAELAVRYQEDARNNGQHNSWGDARGKRSRRRDRGLAMTYLDDDDSAAASTASFSTNTNTETEDDSGVTDNGEIEEMQMTVVLQGPTASHRAMTDVTDTIAVFAMDSELDSDVADAADVSETDEDKLALSPPQYAVDLEISSVYKPRPMRKRFHHVHPGHQHHQNGPVRSGTEKGKKGKEKPHTRHNHSQKEHSTSGSGTSAPANKATARRQARDRRREERKQNLLALAARGVVEAVNAEAVPANGDDDVPQSTPSESADGVQAEADNLAEELEALHVSIGSNVPLLRVAESMSTSLTSTLAGANILVTTTVSNSTSVAEPVVNHSPADPDPVGDREIVSDEEEEDGEVFISPAMPTSTPRFAEAGDEKLDVRLIVEVLVVRKSSIEEKFLDFEGFSFV